MKNLKTILTILWTLQLFCAKGQTEFLVTVDPMTGIHSIINPIPDVNYIYQGCTAFDKNNHRYIFKGKDFGGVNHLYCVDANTSTILSQPLFSLNAGELHYDNLSNTLFGLYISGGQMFVASIDITTASTTIISTLPVVGISDGVTFFDEANHAFVLQSSGNFYSTNVTNGIITTTPAPTAFFEQQFDNSTGTLYGLVMNSTTQLAQIDVSTGTYTIVCSIPTLGYTSTWSSFNEINHVYVFGSNNHLYSVDVDSDSVISSPAFPVGLSGPENVIELHFDNSNGILYALHWGTITTEIKSNNGLDNNNFNIFPNPVNDRLTLDISNTEGIASLSIYSSFGKLLYAKNISNNKVIVDCKEFASGLYILKLLDKNGSSKIVKFIVEK
jgi:hypothetical protein